MTFLRDIIYAFSPLGLFKVVALIAPYSVLAKDYVSEIRVADVVKFCTTPMPFFLEQHSQQSSKSNCHSFAFGYEIQMSLPETVPLIVEFTYGTSSVAEVSAYRH